MSRQIRHLMDKLQQWIKSPFQDRFSSALLQRLHFSNRDKGSSGELLAYHFLRQHGYRIVARNYRRPGGEIDLIGWDGDILCFIEVKLRTQLEHGRPEEAVNWKKQKQICRVAREYRKCYKLHDINYRYDIVSIQGSSADPQLQIIKGAFIERP